MSARVLTRSHLCPLPGHVLILMEISRYSSMLPFSTSSYSTVSRVDEEICLGLDMVCDVRFITHYAFQ